MKTLQPLLTLLLSFYVTLGFAQTKLTGTVSNNKDKPIVKALIYLDSINSNVQTNKEGYYEVMVSETVTDINVYSKKYGLLSSPYNGERKMDFVYIDGKLAASDRIQSNDKVSVGYSNLEKKYVASSVERIEAGEELNALQFQNIYDLIGARLSGVRVTPDNKIIIRGVSSFTSPEDPLFVVDGTIVSSIDHILPIDVKSVDVLKGSEAAIYGTQGGNGVILITTKK